MVEGKFSIWIKGGNFTHRNDLYIQVMCDDREVWKTDEADSYSPQWDSTVVRHIKGDYSKLIFKLMDEDTFSRDDVIGTWEVSFEELMNSQVSGEFDMFDENGECVGTIDVTIEIEQGDVNFFQLMSSRLHTNE